MKSGYRDWRPSHAVCQLHQSVSGSASLKPIQTLPLCQKDRLQVQEYNQLCQRRDREERQLKERRNRRQEEPATLAGYLVWQVTVAPVNICELVTSKSKQIAQYALHNRKRYKTAKVRNRKHTKLIVVQRKLKYLYKNENKETGEISLFANSIYIKSLCKQQLDSLIFTLRLYTSILF